MTLKNNTIARNGIAVNNTLDHNGRFLGPNTAGKNNQGIDAANKPAVGCYRAKDSVKVPKP